MEMILQHILFPSQDTCDTEECYYRRLDENRTSFDTYFNFFSLAKWRKYTELEHITLRLKASGAFRIVVVACDREKNRRVISETTIQSDGGSYERIQIAYDDADEFIWFEFVGESEDARLVSAAYITEDAPSNHPQIAIDICTFKREEYVHRNMNVLKTAILENPDCGYQNYFHIYIVDNGQTLDATELNNNYIRVVPNINAGGSGGFTRGILELLADKKNKGREDSSFDYTHMIFMDDDAVLEPDSLIRTAAFLSYLKSDYDKTVIGGAMHRLDFRYVQHEAGAKWNGVTPVRNHEGVDLRDFDQICENEREEAADYAGWWYACYPLTVVREDNLPLPMFIHCDDMEYGLRNRENGIIYLNGVCVWHNSFEHRRTSSLSYHDIRNIMIMNAITYADGNQKAWNKSMLKRVIGDIFRYRYKDVYLKCWGIEDFMKGPEYYMHIDPIAKLQEVNEEGYRLQPVEEITTDPVAKREVKDFTFATDMDEIYLRKKVPHRKWKLLTLNGMIFPACSEINLHAYPMGIDPYSLYRKARILLFDPYNNCGIILHRDNKEMRKCFRTYRKTMRSVNAQYSEIQKAYQSGLQKAKTAEFWKEYLKIDGNSNQ